MVSFAILWVDIGVEFQLDMIRSLLGVGVAGKGERCGLQVDFGGLCRDIWCGDGKEDVVLLGIALGRALGPEDCG